MNLDSRNSSYVKIGGTYKNNGNAYAMTGARDGWGNSIVDVEVLLVTKLPDAPWRVVVWDE